MLNTKQSFAMDQVSNDQNVFITGPGGVGKSYLTHNIKELYGNETVFIAPTGIAAQNICGATAHSTFGFPIGFITKDHAKRPSDKAQQLFSSGAIKRIFLDELSMSRADMMRAMDYNLRTIKKTNVAFGGLQVIGSGDFFQLSPILKAGSSEETHFKKDFKSPYAFDSESWSESGLQTIELDQIMRQSDEEMINALNSIRKKDGNYRKALKYINDIGTENKPTGEPLFLCSTNKDADFINQERYEELEGEGQIYFGKCYGKTKDIMMVPLELKCKIGMKVLICANNAQKGYFNGQTGFIKNLFDELISVELSDGEVVHVEKYTWEESDYVVKNEKLERTVVGRYVNFPIKIGYAVTIHKSQGLSLDSACIYTGRGLFAHGQGYVALSRLRTMDGLCLINPIRDHEIIVDQRIKDFYDGKIVKNLFS